MSAPVSGWTDDVSTVERRMSVHEAVCAERYASILAVLRDTAHRVTRLEVMVVAAAGSTILGMAGLVATLALRLGKGS
ncbi:MAG TPA: hypothetical protein VKU84_02630 [Stellaceae bacterium]|nr:hypothetical protein [Stellaceae bacterium]